MRALFLLSCLLFAAARPACAQARTVADYYGPYRFEAGKACRVFSDTAYLRAAPGTAAGIADTLFAFDEVSIVDTTSDLLTVGRKEAPWYRVRYRKGGTERAAFLWGGTLAIHDFSKDGVQVACGLLSYPMADAWLKGEQPMEGTGLRDYNTFSIKANDGRGVQECRYNVYRESGFFYLPMDSNGVALPATRPLSGGMPPAARWMTAYGMSGEACGIPSYQLCAAWDGQRLIRMPLLQGTADGGAFYYEEQYIFPGDKGGKPGLLRIRCETGESGDEEGAKMKVTVKWRDYRWDGNGWR